MVKLKTKLYVKMIVAIVWVAIGALPSHGQTSYLDSLKASYVEEPTDTGRVYLARRIAWASFREDVSQAEEYAQKVIDLATGLQDTFQLAAGTHYMGLVQRFEGHFSEAINFFDQALNLYKSIVTAESNYTGPLFNLSYCYEQIGQYEKSLEYALEELRINRETQGQPGVSGSLNGIGMILKKMKDYSQAHKYFQESLAVAHSTQDTLDQTIALHNLSGVYFDQEQYDSSLTIVERARQLNHKIGDHVGLAYSYLRIAEICLQTKQTDKGRSAIRQALEYSRQTGRTFTEVSSLYTLAEIEYEDENYQEALQLLSEVMDADRWTIEATLNIAAIRLKTRSLLRLGRSTEAIDNIETAFNLTDSIYKAESIREVRNLEMRYQVREKESELAAMAQLNAVQEESLHKSKRNTQILIGALALLIFSTILMVRIYQLRLVSRRLALESEQQKVNQLEREKEVFALNSMIDGQEKERARIARDLHDSLGGMMSTIKSHLQTMKSEATEHYGKTLDLINNASEEVRRISHAMLPASLQVLGLRSAIEDLGHKLSSSDLEVDVEIAGTETSIPEAKEVIIYRILQELAQNVIKHAQAQRLLIQLFYTPQELQVLVEDDGVGFDQDAKTDGMGMASIRSRVTYLEGNIEVDSRMGEGTSVQIAIPI